MKNTSARSKRLLGDWDHIRETKAVISGVEYIGEEGLIACSVSGGLFSELEIGRCVSKELDLTVRPKGTVPRMAEIRLYSRAVLDEEAGEWIPKGVYYIDTRKADEASGLLTLHGFDAMLKSGAVWWDPSVDAGEWPMSQRAAAADIARQMNVGIDTRTYIDPSYLADYPNDLTMREVLENIAASHGGNWIMTDEGDLLLVPLGMLPEETSLLVDSGDGGAILFGEVRIVV